jgi:SAM-dependent methyltransferase
MYAVNMQVINANSSRQVLPVLDSAPVEDLFLQLRKDKEAQRFIDTCFDNGRTFRGRITNILLVLGRETIGKWFLNGRSELSGALCPNSLFVLSEKQFRKLLEPVCTGKLFDQTQLLDIGAGDGSVTASVAKACNLEAASVLAVEAAVTKRWRLEKAGFKVSTELPSVSAAFDVVVMLNLLDVTHDPVRLFSDAVDALKPGGFLILGLVLPYRPKLSFGVEPLAGLSQGLNASAEHAAFEVNFVELLTFLSAYPLRLRKWTRVPYLSCGDHQAAIYAYNDAFLILEKT